MDYLKLLRQLAEERQAINEAIAVIAPLVAKSSKKRNPRRPPQYGSKKNRVAAE
jgi:hypothetical protein